MANYSIVSSAKFTPFTFDEMVKPLEMYRDYYKENEELANKLSEDAAEWGRKASASTDPITAATYRRYKEDLESQSDRLLTEGMSPGLRSDLQKMRRRYNTEITPIKEAYNWRLQQIQEQREGRAKGMVYENDAATTSLDEYVKNPSLIYNFADSNAGYNRLATAAQSIANGLADAKITGNLDPYTKKLLITSGYDVSDVSGAINKALSDISSVMNGNAYMDSDAGKLIVNLLNQESKAAGISDWGTQPKNEYMNKVAPALYNLIGKRAVTPMEDRGAISNLELTKQIALADHQLENQKNYAEWAKEHLGTGNSEESDSSSSSGSSSSGGSSDYTYDRDVMSAYDSDGSPKTVKVDAENGNAIMIGNKAKDIKTRVTVASPDLDKNRIRFLVDGEEKVSFNRKQNKVYVKKNNTWTEATGDNLNSDAGDFEGVSLKAVERMARAIADNPGSDNQYSYGITEDNDFFSIQNKAQRVTTGDKDVVQQMLTNELNSYSGNNNDINPYSE